MAGFGWIGAGAEPPRPWDLRHCGWQLLAIGSPVWLVEPGHGQDGAVAGDAPDRLYLGITASADRARLLEAGVGDALPAAATLAEIDQRARRLLAAREALPRWRRVGALTLDLIHRDARTAGRWLALHPREFALLWRLAEQPGEAVTRVQLLREVWRLEHEPGTNSVEVHVSRLRAKLVAAGIAGLVATLPTGGYCLAPAATTAPRVDQRLFA